MSSYHEENKLDASYYIDTTAWDIAVAAVRELGAEKLRIYSLDYRDKLEISRKYAFWMIIRTDKYGITESLMEAERMK